MLNFANSTSMKIDNIFLSNFFSKSGIQYLWQGEISVCKVLVPIKVVPERMTISLIKSSNCINISR